MRLITKTALLAAVGITAAANAQLAFSFADPIPGRQLHNEMNGGGAGIGLLTYDTSAPITFLVDGTNEGFGPVSFVNAHMEMSMTLGAASTFGGVTLAPVSGTFTIFHFVDEARENILTGTASAGSFVRISNTNSMLFSDPDFVYTAGAALAALMAPGSSFSDPSEAVFTLTDVAAVGGGSFIGPGGVFKSFDANASFTGNTTVVPAPAASLALALTAAGAIRRRRA